MCTYEFKPPTREPTLQEQFDQLRASGEWGQCYNPETGFTYYKGSCGPGTIEITFDADTHEVVNGHLKEIDPCS